MSAIVTDISAEAYSVAPDSCFNHWVVFLQFDDSASAKGFIKVDMTPVLNNQGLIQFHHQPCDVTDTADKPEFRTGHPTINNPTVQQIYNLLTTAGQNNVTLDRYKFTDEGNGCAFWVVTFLERLEAEGYLAQGTASQVWGYMQYYYLDNASQGQVQVQGEWQGTFY
jgi:hypothetical protein